MFYVELVHIHASFDARYRIEDAESGGNRVEDDVLIPYWVGTLQRFHRSSQLHYINNSDSQYSVSPDKKS